MSEIDESLPEVLEAESPWPADPEAPDADVADQRREVVEEPSTHVGGDISDMPELPLEADPADAVDQRIVVTDLDEEFP